MIIPITFFLQLNRNENFAMLTVNQFKELSANSTLTIISETGYYHT